MPPHAGGQQNAKMAARGRVERAERAARAQYFINAANRGRAQKEAARVGNVNVTKTTGNIRLTRNVKNAINLENLGPVVVEVWNTKNGNRQYMNPKTFKHFLKTSHAHTRLDPGP